MLNMNARYTDAYFDSTGLSESDKLNRGIPRFFALGFIALCTYYSVYRLKVCSNPA